MMLELANTGHRATPSEGSTGRFKKRFSRLQHEVPDGYESYRRLVQRRGGPEGPVDDQALGRGVLGCEAVHGSRRGGLPKFLVLDLDGDEAATGRRDSEKQSPGLRGGLHIPGCPGLFLKSVSEKYITGALLISLRTLRKKGVPRCRM